MTTRRGLLAGFAGFVACAPAIVRASSLMVLPQARAAAVLAPPMIGEATGSFIVSVDFADEIIRLLSSRSRVDAMTMRRRRT